LLFRALVLALIWAFLIGSAAPALAVSGIVQESAAPAMFDTEAAAQKHCPSDEVVWLNIPTGIYHEKGMRWYGRTKSGAYVCRKEDNAVGDRDTRNGQ
jgi:hypothetical protein